MGKKSYIELVHLSKLFITNSISQEVLHNISVRFDQSSKYAITGISGSGKSTLLYILSGLDHPSHGHVLFEGVDIYTLTKEIRQRFLQKEVGLVFQKPYLMKELSVLENCMLKGYAKQAHHEVTNALELLKALNLKDKIHAPVATLSGGQQQRVALARALYLKPRFLIADEPTAHLDQKTKEAMIDIMINYCQTFNIGIIMSTHDNEVANKMDVVYHITAGCLALTSFPQPSMQHFKALS